MTCFRIHGNTNQGAELATRILGKACFLSGFETIEFFAENDWLVRSEKERNYSKNTDADVIITLNDDIPKPRENLINVFNTGGHVKLPKRIKMTNYHLDATNISLNILKNRVPVLPMMGAIVKITDFISMKNMRMAVENEMGRDKDFFDALDEGNKAVRKMR